MNDISHLSNIQLDTVASSRTEHVARVRHGLARHIIVTVSIAVVVVLVFFLVSAAIIAVTHLNAHTKERVNILSKSVEQLIEQESDKLGAVTESIADNAHLAQAFKQRDRTVLVQSSATLFAALKENHRITHFYYHNVDGTNFLRVHHPSRYGDMVDRHSLAVARQKDKVVSGIELGVLGTYTLRLVKPWHYQNQLIGYIEVGMEVDHLFEKLHKISGLPVAVVIQKRHVTRAQWQQGNEIFGRDSDWEQLADSVVLGVFGDLGEPARFDANTQGGVLDWLAGGGTVYRTIEINDIRQRTIGHLHIAFDESDVGEGTIEVIAYLTMLVVLSLLALVLILQTSIKRVESRLNTAIAERSDFERRVKYDQMTSVYNQQKFYRLLDLELERAVRQ